MTAYLRKSFSVGAPASAEFRDNWEKTFRAAPRADADAPQDLPRDVTRDVQAVFEAAEMVLSVEHPAARVLADEIRAFGLRLASEARNGPRPTVSP